MPRLEAMSIGSRNCPDLGLFCLKDFAKLPRFETANDNMFTDETFKYIATAPVIEHVTNMYCRDDHVHRTGDSFVAYLAASSTIKSVSTWGSHITDEALIALAGMKQLESLLFQNCPASPTPASVTSPRYQS